MQRCFRSLAVALSLSAAVVSWSAEGYAEEKLGPFEIGDPDDVAQLGIGFATQFRGEITGKAQEGTTPEITPRLRLSRLRLILRGSFLEDRSLKMGFQMNTLPGALEVLDMWAQYRFHKQAQVRTGIFKIPFTVHRAQSFATLVLTDWGLGTRHFGAERQLGAKIHNFGAHNFRYAFGVFMGENTRRAFAQRHTAFYGERAVNASDLTTSFTPEEPHPEFVGQVGWGSKDINLKSNTAGKDDDKFRYHVSMSATYDAQPTITKDMKLRMAPELNMKWYGVSLNTVFYTGFSDLSEEGDVSGFAPLMYGPQTELAYRPLKALEFSARHVYVHVTDQLRTDASTRGEAKIAEATEDTLAEVSAQYADAGTVSDLHEVSGGINVYFIGHSLKLQTDASWFPRLQSDVWFHDFQIRSQLQVAF